MPGAADPIATCREVLFGVHETVLCHPDGMARAWQLMRAPPRACATISFVNDATFASLGTGISAVAEKLAMRSMVIEVS